MATREPRRRPDRGLSAGADVSDLIGVKETLWLGIWLVAVVLSFFFVSVVLGIVLIVVGTLVSIALAVNAIRRADTTD